MSDYLTVNYTYQGQKHSFKMPEDGCVLWNATGYGEMPGVMDKYEDVKDGKKDGIINHGEVGVGVHQLITQMRNAGGNKDVLDKDDVTAISNLYDKSPEAYQEYFNEPFKFFKTLNPALDCMKPNENQVNIEVGSQKHKTGAYLQVTM